MGDEELKDLLANAAQQCEVDIYEIHDILPCTALQEGLMAMGTKNPGSYMAQHIFQLGPQVDLEQLKTAWTSTIAKCDILRTRIIYVENSAPLQVVMSEEAAWQEDTGLEDFLVRDKTSPMGYGKALSRVALIHGSSTNTEASFLVWTAQHAVYDGWSVGLVKHMIEQEYGEQQQLVASSFRPTPFSSFIKHLTETGGPNGVTSDDFWRQNLDGWSGVQFPKLPSSAHQVRTNQRIQHTFTRPETTVQGVRHASFIQAAWATVLSRQTGSDDVAFGLTLSGRNAPVAGISKMVGPTITTVPFRLQLNSSDTTVAELLQKVQHISTDMISSEQAGLHHIQSLSSDAQEACQFQSLIAVQPASKGGKQSSDDHQPILIPYIENNDLTGFHTYPLVVECKLHEDSSEVEFDAQYDDVVMKEWDVQRLLEQFAHVLQQLYSQPDSSVGNVDTFSSQDAALVAKWNCCQPKMTKECVHALIQKHVDSRPGEPAVSAWDGELTFSELNDLASRLASQLLRQGVKPGSLVLLCLERSQWVIVAILAVLKTGAGFVPVDSAIPLGRFEQIVQDTGATSALVSPERLRDFDGAVDKVIEVSTAVVADWCDHETVPEVSNPTDVAYVMFTSGSTGRPKGVVIQHQAVCSSIRAHGQAMSFGTSTRALHFASLGFDASIAEILTTLAHGGCVCVPDEEQRLSDIAAAINKYSVNWAFFTPSVIRLLEPSQVPCLKTLVLGGEAVMSDNIKTWAGRVELINGYGPTEVCVFCVSTKLHKTQLQSDIIGLATGATAWVVSLNSNAQLAGLGSIGELWVESPQLAQGYLGHEDATTAAFVVNPPFLQISGSEVRRLYRTGDLVRYNEDGKLRYVGRRDSQIKVRGQRVELSEIEHHLCADEHVESGLVLFPKEGPLAGKVAAVISLTSLRDQSSSASGLRLLQGTQGAVGRLDALKARQAMSALLPSFMVPTAWLVVSSIPLTASGKLDRVLVIRWVAEMGEETARGTLLGEAAEPGTEGREAMAVTITEQMLQLACADVLGLSVEQVSMARSFLSQGGDSITAMQLASRCRAQRLRLSVQDILRCPTLSQLAMHVGTIDETKVPRDEPYDKPFELSPAQELYLQLDQEGTARFNQSFFVRLTQRKAVLDIARAVEALVGQHSMLRARFSKSDEGKWQQMATSEVQKSFNFTVHELSKKESSEKMASVIAKTQAMIDPQTGPIFAANLFEISEDRDKDSTQDDPSGPSQLLFLVAHHLAVDMVSWRILLQQLEELLDKGELLAERPVPFQVWNNLQREYAEDSLSPDVALPFSVSQPDLAFWGLEDQVNVWGDIRAEGFALDEKATSLLLGDCNVAFGTEPVDLFTAALLKSFEVTFPERASPTVFSEGHGREPWDEDIDLSGTVAWFTTMRPVSMALTPDNDILQALRWAKDARHSTPRNGWAYFASRFLNSEGRDVFGIDGAVEIIFNYLGRFQQLERTDALLHQEPRVGGFETADMGPNTPRMAVIDVSASVTEGIASIAISYSSKARHADRIIEWASNFREALISLTELLPGRDRQYTASDLPLLKLAEDDLQKLVQNRLPAIGIDDIDEVEDIYPCSPIQHGILVSQNKTAGHYDTRFAFEIISQDGPIDIDQLERAWQTIVDRHPMLRTIFVDGVTPNGIYTQFVLKHVEAKLVRSVHGQEALVDAKHPHRIPQPSHQLIITDSSHDRVECRLDISHALIDGSSTQVLFGELMLAYLGRLPPGNGPLYRDYIAYLADQGGHDAVAYWAERLAGLGPCHFPRLADDAVGDKKERELRSINFDFGDVAAEIQAFCAAADVTVSNIVHTAWALVLRAYTGSNDVCFGYLTSGRDIPVDQVESIVGPFINMLTARHQVLEETTINDLVNESKEYYWKSLPYQNYSLAEVQHELGLSGQALFNTVISIQNYGGGANGSKEPQPEQEQEVRMRSIGGHDPTEYDVTVNIAVQAGVPSGNIKYWSSVLTEAQAARVADSFITIIRNAVANADQRISALGKIGSCDKELIASWNAIPPLCVDECIHQRIETQAAATPDAEAVSSWDGSLTYSRLDDLSSRLARYLVELGVGPEVCVLICLERSLLTPVATLAVLKAGGTFIPLDPRWPEGRIQEISIQAKPIASLVDKAMASHVGESAGTMVELSDEFVEGLPAITSPVVSTAQPSNAAYIIFTSGSTGRPKGVTMEHRAACSSMKAHGQAMGFGPETRALHFASLGFDASIAEIFTTLSYGGCICIPDEDQRLTNITEVINRHNANWAFFTPSVISLIKPHEVPCLTTLVLGGEAVKSDNIKVWADKTKLINGYGPTEVCVFCVSMPLQQQSRADTIGKAIGSTSWVVSEDGQLAAVGAIGELWIESPQLARGYFGNEEATAAAFVTDHSFFPDSQSRRLYRTGDLVRYNEDGSIRYLGRRDGQVKVRGQRVELSEIEHQLSANENVESGIVLLPQKGTLKGKLTAVVSMSSQRGSEDSEEKMVRVGEGEEKDASEETQALDRDKAVKSGLNLLQGTQQAIAHLQNLKTRRALAAVLPSYMIPAAWLAVKTIPLTTSGKLDRTQVLQWVVEMEEETSREALLEVGDDSNLTADGPSSKAVTPVEQTIQKMCAEVLDLPIERISMARSFLNHGGDSITAMQLASSCREQGMQARVQDILRAQSLSQLAMLVSAIEDLTVPRDEPFDEPFALSPMQQLYFSIQGDSCPVDFSQGVFVRITRQKEVLDIARAVEALVGQHSMLRARFDANASGCWQQSVASDVEDSFEFRVHEMPQKEAEARIKSIVAKTRSRLNARTGQVFAVDLFQPQEHDVSEPSTQVLFIVAHRLVVDKPSWTILLQQLDELLDTGKLSAGRPVPFQVWNRLQSEYVERDLVPEEALPFELQPPRADFWHISDRLGSLNDRVKEGFTLNQDVTDRLLGVCNTAFNSDPVDILTAALVYSFWQTFERQPPTIFHESHGREPWNDNIDLSGTCGWFTTLRPVTVSSGQGDDVLQSLRLAKDARRKTPNNGWAYFASQFLHSRGRDIFGEYSTAEIMFNFTDDSAQPLTSAAVLEPAFGTNNMQNGDLGDLASQLAIFNIHASVHSNTLDISFSFPQMINLGDRIAEWVQLYQTTLIDLSEQLAQRDREYTISDMPLMQLTPATLQKLVEERLPCLGVPIEGIEDIYPSTPIQDEVLMHQQKYPDCYTVSSILKVSEDDKSALEVLDRIEWVWTQLIERHPSLRTVFAPTVRNDNGKHDQILLKSTAVSFERIHVADKSAMEAYNEQHPVEYLLYRPSCLFRSFLLDSGEVMISMDISHAVFDAWSGPNLVAELRNLYSAAEYPLPSPPFSDHVAQLFGKRREIAKHHWQKYLQDLHPSLVPRSGSGDRSARKPGALAVEFKSDDELKVLCEQNGFTIQQIVHAAWAMVVGWTLQSESVCFGYLTHGRHANSHRLGGAIGGYFNILATVASWDAESTFRSVLEAVREDAMDNSELQDMPQVDAAESLGIQWPPFNTLINYAKFPGSSEGEEPKLKLEPVFSQGLSEYDMNVGILEVEEKLHISIGFFDDAIAPAMGKAMAKRFEFILRQMCCHTEDNVLDVMRRGNEVTELGELKEE